MTSGPAVPTSRFPSSRVSACLCAILLGVLTSTHSSLGATAPPETISLTAVSPPRASAGAHVFLAGTGFHPVGINNRVIFTPALGGPAVVAEGRSVTTLDATKGLSRLEVRVPAGLPAGPTGVQVRVGRDGPVSSKVLLEVIAVAISPPVTATVGTTVTVRFLGSANTKFTPGTTIVTDGRVTVTAIQVVSPTELIATIAVKEDAPLGQRFFFITSDGQSARVDSGFQVVPATTANRNPVANANGPYSSLIAQPVVFNSAGSTDPDGDTLQFAWDFGDGSSAVTPNPQHAYVAGGQYVATLTVSDGRGGTASATAAIAVTTPVTLLSLVASPPALRFADLNATAALLVTGRYSDGSDRDLTAGATGTTYTTSAPAVATANADGVVTSVGDGGADITIANGGASVTVPVVVEQGVALQSLELTPPIVTLRELGTSEQVTLRGSFSDGSLRDLSGDPGTTFSVDAETIASVSASGLVTALAPGASTLTARSGSLSATAQVRVILTDGSGFLRGEVFDDSRGLPLSTATATVLVGGGAAVVAPTPVPADDRGRFTLPAPSGAALVRVERPGFTAVDRQADLARGGVLTLLDARLTPLDGRLNVLQSVFGGEARSTDGSAVVSVPSGSLAADASLRVTPISPQGLQGRLPTGWSPIAAVDLQPAGRQFAQPANLRLLHTDTLGPGSAVSLAFYDAAVHQWVVQPPGQVSDDRRTLAAPIDRTGQFAFVVPDDVPSVPPPAIPGQVLAGVAGTPVPDTATASGLVLPRSAPPGEGARAVGTVILQPPAPLSSGAVLRARVSEQFDLLDSSRIVPLQFVQDVVLFARPSAGEAGTLAGRLPITPSLQFTIQQLSLGTVRLDVTINEPSADSTIVGTPGGSVTDAAGNVLEVPPGALGGDIAVGLLPLSAAQLSASVPDGFTLLGAVLIDLVGTSFGQPAPLSIPRPPGLAPEAQILVAQVISDNGGGRRLKIVGLGAVSPARVSVQTTLGSLTFEGVRGGGEFAFLQPLQPLGFITGLVSASGSGAHPLALVTTNTAPFAFLTTAAGTFVVAGRAGAPTTVAAIDPTGATASGAATLAALNDVAALNLTLAQIAPVVTATIPAANATNVALDSPIVIDFSKPIDPATVTGTSVALSAGATPVGAQPVLSANRRRLTITPASPLAGLTAYTLTLTSDLRDSAGIGLGGFTPLQFTTLDPSKATVLALGVITAELPDEDGLALVTGAAGAAEPNSVVVATNLRSQETVSVLSTADGSFRLRLAVVVGDEVTLTFRDATGRETTIAISQLSGAGGLTSIGTSGGSIQGADGRTGRVLRRALSTAGLFAIDGAADAVPPSLPAPFLIADQFALRIEGAAFKRIESLTLTEAQQRIVPATAFSTPFISTGGLTVPADFLVTASLRFAATVVDGDGARRSASAATVVVASDPDTSSAQTGLGDEFPTVFLTAPRQAIPSQIVGVSAVAPAARVELDFPAVTTPPSNYTVMLTRLVEVSGETKLSLVDRLARTDVGGLPRLRTAGHELPGATRAGDYAVVSGPVAFITGRVNGPAAMVTADGLPFVFETGGANAGFTLPVLVDAPFVLRFTEAATGAVLGSANGQAPAAGAVTDIGRPLAPSGGALTVSAQPDVTSVADIATPIVFTFSDPVDRSSVTAGAFVVTDPAGVRVFGQVAVSTDGRSVTFVPSRRWRFATQYRYGVSTSVVAASGARLAQQFSGEFTTFAPSLLGSVAIDARDVAVAGTVGVVATASGMTVLDLATADAPTPLASVVLAGGARGVAFTTTPLTDRNGQTVSAPVAVVASGDRTTTAVLQSYSLAAPAAPALLGSTQLTTPAGQTPPAGVPGTPGAPSAVVINPSNLALVPVRDLGLQSVVLATAIPNDAENPGAALGPRFPATGVGDATAAVALGSRTVVAGPTGLKVLDSNTLEEIGSSSGIALTTAAGLTAFSFDANGDGRIDPAIETSDLIVAGDESGVLQIHRLAADATTELISAVRLPGSAPIGGVAVNADEGMAYVGVGARGLALVDLRGPAGVQPVDADRDGLDDRILGFVDTPSAAGRVALDLGRGVGYVADGTGLAIVQLTPPRVRLLSVSRDPVLGRSGDEESIVATHTAFVSDDAIQIRIAAAIPPRSATRLVIQESPVAGGARVLTLLDGSTSAGLVPGETDVTILIGNGSAGAHAVLRVQDGGGAGLAEFAFYLDPADEPQGALVGLFVAPVESTIQATDASLQLSVGGRFADGRVLNLTAADAGSTYTSSSPGVASVDANGNVSPLGGGATDVVVANRGAFALATVVVDRPPSLIRFSPAVEHLTFRSGGETAQASIAGVFSDGSERTALEIAGTVFTSSDPQVASVDSTGLIRAVGDGLATLAVVNGDVRAEVRAAVELRQPASISAIDIQPFSNAVSLDQLPLGVTATLIGAGSLDGVPVTFTVTGPSSTAFPAISSLGGTVGGPIAGLTRPGAYSVTVSVTDPATQSQRSDTEQLTVTAGAGDNEPNESLVDASPLSTDRPISGSINPLTDPSDVFRVPTDADGILDLTVAFGEGVDLTGVTIVVRSSTGVELARVTPTEFETRLSLATIAGDVLVSLSAASQVAAYELSARTKQATIDISSVSPLAGGPATAVAITGAGFSARPGQTMVLFGGVAGKIVAVTPSRIDVLVPAQGANGAIEVISGGRAARGPVFATGLVSPPQAFILPTPPQLRMDPISGHTVDISKLIVAFDPTAGRAAAEEVAARVSAQIRGFLPTDNEYVFYFAQNQTIEGLATLRRQLRAEAAVVRVLESTITPLMAPSIDSRDRGGRWPGTSIPRSRAFDQIRLFEAIQAIRRTPPFDRRGILRSVKVAVLDSGFDPEFYNEEFGAAAVRVFERDSQQGIWALRPLSLSRDLTGHGTKVASVIGALNNGTAVSGVLNSVAHPGEEPFQVTVFVVSLPNEAGIIDDLAGLALEAIKADGDYDVVNMSFGDTYAGRQDRFLERRDFWKRKIQPLVGRSLVVMAAGNESVRSDFFLPADVQSDLANVIGVGAVNVGDAPGPGPVEDARAFLQIKPVPILQLPVRERRGVSRDDVPCAPIAIAQLRELASNCGKNVAIAAPGIRIYTADQTGYSEFRGTSAAAPIVAGVAALLQAIRPSLTPIAPVDLRGYLINSGDDITAQWRPDVGVRRLNALAAARAVLPALAGQRVFISDSELSGSQDIPGAVVSIDVDPMTGRRLPAATDAVIRLIPSSAPAAPGLVRNFGGRPSSMVVSPHGDRLYVAHQGAGGFSDGISFVNTETLEAESFLALANQPHPWFTEGPPSHFSTPRPGMAISKDGRLLYVSLAYRVMIVNTVNQKIVRDLEDLPRPYNLRAHVADGTYWRRGVRPPCITSHYAGELTLSPDGKRLYVLCRELVGGTGRQPGYMSVINVDLYTDGDPSTPQLESDLSHFFLGVEQAEIDLTGPLPALSGDEPSDVVASPDGKHVYVTHGGVKEFASYSVIDVSPIQEILHANILRVATAGSAGLAGLAISIAAFTLEQARLFDEMRRTMVRDAEDGYTLLNATGLTQVFDGTAANPGSPSWAFPSQIVFGWNPNPENAGGIVNQNRFSALFAKRPFGMTIHPSGRRALVSYFQTGNYGVLDLDGQQSFFTNPAVAGLADTAFQGLFAVTPALFLDDHLWPTRGAYRARDGRTVPSPDEALLYPGQVEYAQNGRFAVGVHTGNGAPEAINTFLPDFETDVNSTVRLRSIGFNIEFGATSGTDPDGLAVTSGQPYTFVRGGGAITIFDDQALVQQLADGGPEMSDYSGSPRPYLATIPVCGTDCKSIMFDYRVGGGTERFARPRGVAIQSFVNFESPTFGDTIRPTTGIAVSWRDSRVVRLNVRVHDLGHEDAPLPAPAVVAIRNGLPISSDEQAQRFVSRTFRSLFGTAGPVDGHRYRIEAEAVMADGRLLSSTTVDARFKQ